MAQALVDLQYYKCGHCSEKFKSLAAFGKHQKERHTPKGAPSLRGIPSQRVLKDLSTPTEKVLDNTPSTVGENQKKTCNTDLKTPNFQASIKLKLCKDCLNTICVVKQNKLQVTLCDVCLRQNGLL